MAMSTGDRGIESPSLRVASSRSQFPARDILGLGITWGWSDLYSRAPRPPAASGMHTYKGLAR